MGDQRVQQKGSEEMKAEIEARIIKVIDIAILLCIGGVCGWVLKVWVG